MSERQNWFFNKAARACRVVVDIDDGDDGNDIDDGDNGDDGNDIDGGDDGDVHWQAGGVNKPALTCDPSHSGRAAACLQRCHQPLDYVPVFQ